MDRRGIGDRWLAGEPIAGVAFHHHQRVEVASGPRAGERGIIRLLVAMRPEPAYFVELDDAGGDLRVRQSALRPFA